MDTDVAALTKALAAATDASVPDEVLEDAEERRNVATIAQRAMRDLSIAMALNACALPIPRLKDAIDTAREAHVPDEAIERAETKLEEARAAQAAVRLVEKACLNHDAFDVDVDELRKLLAAAYEVNVPESRMRFAEAKLEDALASQAAGRVLKRAMGEDLWCPVDTDARRIMARLEKAIADAKLVQVPADRIRAGELKISNFFKARSALSEMQQLMDMDYHGRDIDVDVLKTSIDLCLAGGMRPEAVTLLAKAIRRLENADAIDSQRKLQTIAEREQAAQAANKAAANLRRLDGDTERLQQAGVLRRLQAERLMTADSPLRYKMLDEAPSGAPAALGNGVFWDEALNEERAAARGARAEEPSSRSSSLNPSPLRRDLARAPGSVSFPHLDHGHESLELVGDSPHRNAARPTTTDKFSLPPISDTARGAATAAGEGGAGQPRGVRARYMPRSRNGRRGLGLYKLAEEEDEVGRLGAQYEVSFHEGRVKLLQHASDHVGIPISGVHIKPSIHETIRSGSPTRPAPPEPTERPPTTPTVADSQTSTGLPSAATAPPHTSTENAEVTAAPGSSDAAKPTGGARRQLWYAHGSPPPRAPRDLDERRRRPRSPRAAAPPPARPCPRWAVPPLTDGQRSPRSAALINPLAAAASALQLAKLDALGLLALDRPPPQREELKVKLGLPTADEVKAKLGLPVSRSLPILSRRGRAVDKQPTT